MLQPKLSSAPCTVGCETRSVQCTHCTLSVASVPWAWPTSVRRGLSFLSLSVKHGAQPDCPLTVRDRPMHPVLSVPRGSSQEDLGDNGSPSSSLGTSAKEPGTLWRPEGCRARLALEEEHWGQQEDTT